VLAQRKFVELMFDDAVAPDHTAAHVGLIEQFKRDHQPGIAPVLGRQADALAGPKIATEEGREVTHDDFLSWLQFCVTGNHHPVSCRAIRCTSMR
jgi:type IV secretion system protein VirB4